MNKIVVPLDNGYKLVAELNIGSEFNKEIFVGIETETGKYVQDLVVIRPTYHFVNNNVEFDSDKFEMLVFGDSKQEDYTDKFIVPIVEEENEDI